MDKTVGNVKFNKKDVQTCQQRYSNLIKEIIIIVLKFSNLNNAVIFNLLRFTGNFNVFMQKLLMVSFPEDADI